MEKDTIGVIDGISILRYTHAFSSGGGIENYLKELNRALLCRNAIKIIQINYLYGIDKPVETTYDIGRGVLVSIEIPPPENPTLKRISVKSVNTYAIKSIASFICEYATLIPVVKHIFSPLGKRLFSKSPGISCESTRELFTDIFERYKIDLLSLHCLGADDTGQIIKMATERNIPFFYLNHYENSKFNQFQLREQLSGASGIAGISTCGIPKFVKNRFVSLPDGVDTTFFSNQNCYDPIVKKDVPVVFLPARICEGKGHLDIIEAIARLKDEGIQAHVIFAGRKDSPEFFKELQSIIEKNCIRDSVTMIGECNSEQIRALYAHSSVVAVPSRSEGLSRVLLEAQSMCIPVVTYDTGGTSQALLPERSGFLCKLKSIDTLKSALRKLLTDKELRTNMGMEGRKFVIEKYSLDIQVRKHEGYYCSILEHHKVNSILVIR
jgi:glycosyltransferase involved in cell wall biosynthesis